MTIERSIHSLVPGLVTLLLIIFSVIPKYLEGWSLIMPFLGFMAVFYWSVYRPQYLPNWFVFICGLIQDALMGLPFGLSAAIMLIMRMVIISQHRFMVRETFAGVWLVFLTISGAVSLLLWASLSLYDSVMLPVRGTLLQWIVSVMLYPVIHRLLSLIYQWLPGYRRHAA